MPPTAYNYAPNQVHNSQEFGPICRQRFPIELASLESGSQEVGTKNLELELRLMRRMMTSETFAQLKPLIKELASSEQSEDCLNLNIFVPIQGKFQATILQSRLYFAAQNCS